MIPEDLQLPQDIPAERALLGVILNYSEALEEVAHIVREQHFFYPVNGMVYAACNELFLHQQPIDPITVASTLAKSRPQGWVGGRTYLAQLQTEGFVRKNITHYANVVISEYQKRQIITIAQETVWKGRLAHTITAEEFLDETLQKFFSLTGATGRTAEKLGDGAVADYITVLGSPQPPPRLSWPWADLDKILHGLRPGEMTVIGGRPGQGKTALAMNLAIDLGMNKKKAVGIFSLEMSKRQLINRMLAQLATVDSSELQDAKITPQEWERVLEVSIPLSEALIYVDDDSSLSEVDLISKTRKMRYQHDIDCIILDYLQLLRATGKSGNREQEVSGFAQTAKRIARDLDIAVVVLSSLNRGPEFREDHRPMISDFRESGGIENEADVILGLYRDYYYNPKADPQDAEVIVLKQRNGPTGTVHLKFEKKYTMFWSEGE